MGEIADMMLDGTLCASCGCELGQDAGYPIYCASCEPDFIDSDDKPPPSLKTHECPTCGKMFRGGLARDQHTRDRHGST